MVLQTIRNPSKGTIDNNPLKTELQWINLMMPLPVLQYTIKKGINICHV